MTDLNEMWTALEQYQPYADKARYGGSWKRMTTERTSEAAASASAAARDATYVLAGKANPLEKMTEVAAMLEAWNAAWFALAAAIALDAVSETEAWESAESVEEVDRLATRAIASINRAIKEATP